VIEIVDSPEQIGEFIAAIDGLIGSGLVTVEKVQVLKYGDGSPA
jgi:PII-like signaling protein